MEPVRSDQDPRCPDLSPTRRALAANPPHPILPIDLLDLNAFDKRGTQLRGMANEHLVQLGARHREGEPLLGFPVANGQNRPAINADVHARQSMDLRGDARPDAQAPENVLNARTAVLGAGLPPWEVEAIENHDPVTPTSQEGGDRGPCRSRPHDAHIPRRHVPGRATTATR